MHKSNSLWNRAFTTTFIVNIFNSLGFHILTPILPKYAVSLSLDNSIAGLIGTIFTFTAILSRLLLIKVNMQGRYRRFMIASLAIIAVSITGFAFSASAAPLIAFRLLQGLGWGVCSTVVTTLAALSLPREKAGAGIGLFGLGSVFGSAIAPNLGLNLVSAIGYRSTFLLAMALPLTGVILCLFLRDLDKVDDVPARPSAKGIAFRDIDWRPLLPTIIIALAVIPSSGVSNFIALTAESQGVRNIGMFFTIHAFSLLFARPFFGRISDKVQPWKLLIPSMCCYAGVMVALRFASSLPVYLIIALFYGLSYGSVNPTVQSWSVRVVDKSQYGMAQIIYYTGFDLGSGLGGMIAGAVAEAAGYSQMYLWLMIPIAVDLLILTGCMAADRRKKAHSKGVNNCA